MQLKSIIEYKSHSITPEHDNNHLNTSKSNSDRSKYNPNSLKDQNTSFNQHASTKLITTTKHQKVYKVNILFGYGNKIGKESTLLIRCVLFHMSCTFF